jgi:hypothetical protein
MVEATVLELEPVFAPTVYETVPFPVPGLPEVMVNHEAPLLAVHVQPAWVVTWTLPVPPCPVIEAVVGEME